MTSTDLSHVGTLGPGIESEDVSDYDDVLADAQAAALGDTHDEVRRVDPHAAFWTQRNSLKHVLDFARARRVGPWAVLGTVLARAVSATEPNVVLPPEIGTEASLNLFLALCGMSGDGKGTAEGTAHVAVKFCDRSKNEIPIATPNPGSGEGLAKLFARPDEEDGGERVTRAFLSVPEIGTLAALSGRQGSTLTSELLKVFIGEPIGFTNSQKSTSSAVGRHEYRLCLAIGVQPENAATLFDATKDGLPQRFLWLPVADPYAPRTKPKSPKPLSVTIPKWQKDKFEPLVIPAVVSREIDDHRYRVLTGEPVDPLDSHRLLVREKIGAALMLLDGRSMMNDDDWNIAGQILEVSDETRIEMQRVLDEKRRRTNRARANADAERAEIVAERADDRLDRRACEGILRYLDRHGESPRKKIRDSLRSELRDRFDGALDTLLDAELVRQAGDGYRLG